MNDPNVKVGQVYQYYNGYFKVDAVSGGFANVIHNNGEKQMVLRNQFQANIGEGTIRLVTDEIELAKVLLLF